MTLISRCLPSFTFEVVGVVRLVQFLSCLHLLVARGTGRRRWFSGSAWLGSLGLSIPFFVIEVISRTAEIQDGESGLYHRTHGYHDQQSV